MQAYPVVVELSEMQLHTLWSWEKGEAPEAVAEALLAELGRQIGLQISQPFEPKLGEWTLYGERPAKVVGKTKKNKAEAGADYHYIVEVFERPGMPAGSLPEELRQVEAQDLAPYVERPQD